MNDLLLEIENLSKRYCRDPKLAASYAMRDVCNDVRWLQNRDYLRKGEFWALRDVNMQVAAGEVVGLIGHNGAGKSTLINLAAGVLRPTVGRITLYSDRVVLMDHHGGLSPVQTGRENIGNQLSLYGMHEDEIAETLGAVAAYSDLGDFIEAPVGTYSLGMKLRLAFAIYSRLKPDIFIVDEALGGGDLRFRNKFLRFLRGYIDDGGSILVASHDLFSVQSLCHRCILMEQGRVHTVGTPQEVIHTYNLLALEKDRSDSTELEDNSEFIDSLLGIDKSTEVSGDQELHSLDAVEFTSVEVTGPGRDPIYPNSPIRIEIVCESAHCYENVFCALEIGSAEVFPLSSIIGGYEEQPFHIERGKSRITCEIDSFPLAPGIYYLSAYFVQPDSGAVLGSRGHHDERVVIEVLPRPGLVNNITMYRKNLVHMSANWRHSNEARQTFSAERIPVS